MAKLNNKLKIFSIVFIFIFIVEIIFIAYQVLYNATETLYFDGINAIDKSGDYFFSVGSNNDNVNNYERAKLTRYNKKREKDFEKLYNVGFNSTFWGLCFDDDYIVAVGSYEKTSTEHNNLTRRALIVKYDLDGNIIFQKDFNLLDNSKFTNIIVASDGYYVCGQSVYKSTKIGNDSGGAVVVKYDKDGNMVWMQLFGSNKQAVFNDLLILGDNIYLVGADNSHVGIICKYNLDGKLLNSNEYKYIDDIGFSGLLNIDDSIYVSGANRDLNSTNAMIVQYDLDCNYLKDVTYNNSGSIRYNKLLKDSNNNIIAIGIISSKKESDIKTAEQLNYDGIIGKYNLSLEELQVDIYGDERDDYFTDIIEDEKNYLVVGYSSYEDGSYYSKFIHYSDALKILGVD